MVVSFIKRILTDVLFIVTHTTARSNCDIGHVNWAVTQHAEQFYAVLFVFPVEE